MSTIFHEGQTVVDRVGGGLGQIIALAGGTGAHVKWATGPFAGNVELTEVYDLEPAISARKPEEDPMHLVAVRRSYDREGERGVLNFLASNSYLDGWQKIAREIVEYTEECIRRDASMELVDEQLSPSERDMVVQAAALTLLRDAFAETEV